MKLFARTVAAGAGLWCAGVLAVLALSVGVASAADAPTSVVLAGGALAVSAPMSAGTFSGTLTGAPEVFEGASFSGIAVTDARGTGAGWQLVMRATQFECAGVVGASLAPDSLTAPLFAATKADQGSSAVPGTVRAAPIDNATGAVIAVSAAGEGMGTYVFTAADGVPWRLAVTADEYAGVYYSTVTTTVATLAL